MKILHTFFKRLLFAVYLLAHAFKSSVLRFFLHISPEVDNVYIKVYNLP